VQAHHVDSVGPPQLDRGDVPPQLVHLVFDVDKDVCRLEVWEDLGDELARDGQALVKRDDV
jgi:hypothetical protein